MPSSLDALEPVASLLAGDAEKHKRPQAEIDRRADFVDESIDAELIIAGHGGDFFFDVPPRANKQRQDQILGRQIGLPDQGADDGMMAKTTGAVTGKHLMPREYIKRATDEHR